MKVLEKTKIERNTILLLYPSNNDLSPIGIRGDEVIRYSSDKFNENPFEYISIKPHHIHILSNDTIEKGDYIYDEKDILKVNKVGKNYIYCEGKTEPSRNFLCYKIIASSDKMLSLPLISDSFVKEITNDHKRICNVITHLVKTDDDKLVYDINDKFELNISRVDRLSDIKILENDDIMVGNFVYNQNIVCRISCGDDIDFCEEYLPIKITEYWINKLNFNKVSENVYKDIYKNLFIEKTINGYEFYIGEGSEYIYIRNVKYVHEIQNLYKSITGNQLDHIRDIND